MPAVVYEIKNLVNGKTYIGSSSNYVRRSRTHKTALRSGKHQNSHLQRAWLKYGESSFTFTVLILCSSEMMRFYEQRCIDGLTPQYNQSKSAFSGIPAGSTLSEQHRKKLGAISAMLWGTEEYRNKTAAAIQDSMTPDECNKRSERTKKLWADPVYRGRAVAARKGNAYCKGYKCTPEQVLNRKRAARISNMKRVHGENWKTEYVQRYPEYAGDVSA